MNQIGILLGILASPIAFVVGSINGSGGNDEAGTAIKPRPKDALAVAGVILILGIAVPPLWDTLVLSLFIVIAPILVMSAIYCFRLEKSESDVVGCILLLVLVICFFGFFFRGGEGEQQVEASTKVAQKQAIEGKYYKLRLYPGQKISKKIDWPYRISYSGLTVVNPKGVPKGTIFADEDFVIVPGSDEASSLADRDPQAYIKSHPNAMRIGGDFNPKRKSSRFRAPCTLEFRAVYNPVTVVITPL